MFLHESRRFTAHRDLQSPKQWRIGCHPQTTCHSLRPSSSPAKHLHPHFNTSQRVPLNMSARYERLPTFPSNDNELDSFSEELESRLHSNSSSQQHSSLRELDQQLHADPRFSPLSPPRWQRLALIVVVVLLYWLAYRMPRAGVPALMDA